MTGGSFYKKNPVNPGERPVRASDFVIIYLKNENLTFTSEAEIAAFLNALVWIDWINVASYVLLDMGDQELLFSLLENNHLDKPKRVEGIL